MRIDKFHIYLADLNSRMGTEPGKVRPVVVVQTDLLNNVHPSTVVCPLTTNVVKEAQVLRVHLGERSGGLKTSDVMVDQVRAIDNKRFIKHVGRLTSREAGQLTASLRLLILE